VFEILNLRGVHQQPGAHTSFTSGRTTAVKGEVRGSADRAGCSRTAVLAGRGPPPCECQPRAVRAARATTRPVASHAGCFDPQNVDIAFPSERAGSTAFRTRPGGRSGAQGTGLGGALHENGARGAARRRRANDARVADEQLRGSQSASSHSGIRKRLRDARRTAPATRPACRATGVIQLRIGRATRPQTAPSDAGAQQRQAASGR